jgi:hypothetical protein
MLRTPSNLLVSMVESKCGLMVVFAMPKSSVCPNFVCGTRALISSFVMPRRNPSNSGAAGMSAIFFAHWAAVALALATTTNVREIQRRNDMARNLRPKLMRCQRSARGCVCDVSFRFATTRRAVDFVGKEPK